MKYVVLVLVLIISSAVFAEGLILQTTTAKKTSTSKPKPKPTPARKTTATKPKTAPTKKTTTAKPKTTTAKNSTVSKPKSPAAKTTAVAKPKPKPLATPTPTPLTEKEQFDKASGYELAADRVAALEKFLAAFPESENKLAAADLLASSRVLIAEEKLLSGDSADAASMYRRVIEEAPQPIPNDLFNESIAKIPLTLFRHGQRAAALELASLIESKVEGNALQLIEIANFHLGLENGAEAMRVAAKAAAKDPSSSAVYRTLALAHRINFDIDLAADSYAKALELEPDSFAAKRGLAEMKRALGKSDDAVGLYRELISKNEADVSSRIGLTLALFDAGKRAEAEAEMAKTLERSPQNIILLAGAAYWYASKGLGDKSVELAQKAVEREPRYIWSHIALGRGLMAQGKPVAAEQALVKARAYGNFPTLEYEIASARAAAGFYRDAADDLSTQFSVNGSVVSTRLGGRVVREEKSLADLVAQERKASIFTPVAADTNENAEILKALLDLEDKVYADKPNESDIAAAADAFVKGSDKMKLHRQMYAASLLLQNRVALSKVLELTKAATGNTDTALDVPDPGAAVMASELYEARAAAFRKKDFLLVPDVPKPTLSAILRGRIEEIAGWTLYQQNNFPEAIVRLRRAITVMPQNSTWWRSSVWRLGAALAADGKDAEALTVYIDSYKGDKPDAGKYAIVEALYRKVNGNIDGLEEKIGSDHVMAVTSMPEAQPSATPAVTQTVETNPVSTSSEPAAPASTTKEPATTAPTPEPSKSEAEVKPQPSPTTEPEKPTAEPAAKPEPSPSEQKPATEPAKEPEKEPDAKPPDQKAEPPAEQKQEPKPAEQKPEPPPDQKQEPKPTEQKAEPPAEQKQEAKPVEPSPEPPPDKKPESNPVESKTASHIPDTSKPILKPLFEPIIITIPNSRPAKPINSDATKTTSTETKKLASDARPRVIDGQEVKLEEAVPACKVVVSQENLSLINNGGRMAILVNLEGGDIKELNAASSSEKDIEITLQPEIAGFPDRRFYVVKSTSTAVGVYQVTFSAPCGKKDVAVSVR